MGILRSQNCTSNNLMTLTFEFLEVEQSYKPLLKALMCGIDAVGAQGCSCMSTFCHAPLKIALLLHKMANECKQPLVAVVDRYQSALNFVVNTA